MYFFSNFSKKKHIIVSRSARRKRKKTVHSEFFYGPTEYPRRVSRHLDENCGTSSILKSKNEILRKSDLLLVFVMLTCDNHDFEIAISSDWNNIFQFRKKL